jgi:hypothetical protein
MIFADVIIDGNQSRHFMPDIGQIESFDTVKRVVRKQLGQVEIITIGCVPDDSVNKWTPPAPPDGFKFNNVKVNKFAFGRRRKPAPIKARPDDFEDDNVD